MTHDRQLVQTRLSVEQDDTAERWRRERENSDSSCVALTLRL